MSEERNQVVIEGMWLTIKTQHAALEAVNPTLEWLFDRLPQDHRLEAAKRMDAVHQLMGACNELVAPMRKIMEGDR